MTRIMIIDDSRLVGRLVERMLVSQNIDILQARTGAELFGDNGATSALHTYQPHLILLDIYLPDMNGLDILDKLQTMEEGKNIPVIMISSSASLVNMEQAAKKGAAGFLSKPFKPKGLYEELARVAKTTGMKVLAQDMFKTLGLKAKAKEGDDPSLIIGPSNLNGLLDIIDGDRKMLHTLVSVFVRDMPEALDQVSDAVQAEDPDLVRRMAHGLKGLVANMGMPRLTRAALTMEQKGHHKDLDQADQLMEVIKRDANALHMALFKWLQKDNYGK